MHEILVIVYVFVYVQCVYMYMLCMSVCMCDDNACMCDKQWIPGHVVGEDTSNCPARVTFVKIFPQICMTSPVMFQVYIQASFK